MKQRSRGVFILREKRNNMNKRPFVTISVCWTIGSVFTLMNMWIELIVVGLFILMLLLIRPKSRVVYVGAFLAILLSTGWCLLYDHLQQSQLVSEWDDHVDSVIVTAIGQISSPLKIDGDRVSFALKTEQTLFHDQATVFTRRERMQVMLTLRSESEQLAVAQQLR